MISVVPRRFFLWTVLPAMLLAGCTATRPATPRREHPPRAAQAPLTITPEHPQAGRPVTVTYAPQAQAARLHDPDTLEVVYRSEQADYRIVPMTRHGARWSAQITPGSSARFLRLYVQSDSVKDRHGSTHGSVGWGRVLYGPDGRPVRGAYVARAAFLREQYEGAPQRDALMRAAYRRERAQHPDNLVALAHLRALEAAPPEAAPLGAQQDTARAEALRRSVVDVLDSVRRGAGPQRLREVQRAYYALGLHDRAQSVGATLIEQAPAGPEAAFAAFRRATADGMGPARAQRRADDFVERFPQSFFKGGVYESLFKKYRDAHETQKMLRAGRRWLRTEEINRARALGLVAQALAGAGRYDAAVAHAERAIAAAPEAPRGYTFFKTNTGWDWAPTPLTPKERRVQARRQRGRQRAVLGRIYYRQQRYAQAARVLAQAVRENAPDPAAWTHLAEAYAKTNRPDAAYAAAEEAVRRAPLRRPPRALFRRLYAQRHGSEEGLGAAVARLARGKLLAERLDEPAPALRFTRLGAEAPGSAPPRAADGTVRVVDFWATWCGPCRQAFPHLQKVYEKYRDAPDVQFLVANTSWNDSRARARQFIEQAGYTFPLYWDAGGQTARALGVGSIPTTVLIGKRGRVQYREAGFGGPEHYEENLTLRIELLRTMSEEGPQEKSGGASE